MFTPGATLGAALGDSGGWVLRTRDVGDDAPMTLAEPVELGDDCCSPVVVVVGPIAVVEGVAVARALVVVVGDGSLVGRSCEAEGCGVPQPASRQAATTAPGTKARQPVN
jgi:hypothetical protein